eukprot:7468710-Karenia_brevis.AAC.1
MLSSCLTAWPTWAVAVVMQPLAGSRRVLLLHHGRGIAHFGSAAGHACAITAVALIGDNSHW